MDGFAPPSSAGPIFYIGTDGGQKSGVEPQAVVDDIRECGYDYVTLPISNHRYFEEVQRLVQGSRSKAANVDPLPLVPSLSPTFTDLTPDSSTASVIGRLSQWADVTSEDATIAHVSRQVLSVEIAYAAFCGVSNVILPPVFRGNAALAPNALQAYTNLVSQSLAAGPYLQLLVPMPMDDQRDTLYARSLQHLPADDSSQQIGTEAAVRPHDAMNPYDAWNYIRMTCRYSAKLALALTIPRLLSTDHLQSRWFAEPLRILNFRGSSFAANQRGYPVLSKAHQTLLYRYMQLQQAPWILLSDLPAVANGNTAEAAPTNPTPAESAQLPPQIDPTPQLTYMRHLQMTQPPLPPLSRFAQGYQDFLQSPLQPLTDNLESITYEVFEKDPIKYSWYEKAIALALRDLHATLQRPLVLAVVGAGRGPLVTRSLMASASTGIPIKPYAIEKNPNAYVLLQRHNATNPLWANKVQIVKTDMRLWSGPVDATNTPMKIDILVSELLGSFADNELSPECLDGAQHLLHPSHGVSIPQSYTAWVSPISTPRIHADLLHRPNSETHKWDLPYVTMLHQFSFLSFGEEPEPPNKSGQMVFPPIVKQAWEFIHPLPEAVLAQSKLRQRGGTFAPGTSGGEGWNDHNARSTRLIFGIGGKGRGVCHGLAGYFESVLYESREGEKVELSTNPVSMEAKSADMISWFPIFFPLKTPVFVSDGAEVEVVMERRTDGRMVWYEWGVNVWVEIGGVRQRVGGGEMQSSRENGCLM